MHRHLRISLGILIVMSLLAASVTAQNTWYVAPGGNGSGTENSPLGSIQGAIAAAAIGDTVLVEAGTYLENLNFLGKDIWVKSRDGADVTTIDGRQLDSTVRFGTGCTDLATLTGFTITGGEGAFGWVGGGIDVEDASASITHCRIIGNSRPFNGGHGAGVLVENGSHPVVIFNCLIQANDGLGRGTAAYAVSGSEIRMGSCTVVGNSSNDIYDAGHLLNANGNDDSIHCVNSAFYLNLGDITEQVRGNVTIEYCFADFVLPSGMNNLSFLNPGFVDPLGVSGPVDFHLSETSLLIDKGTLNYPWGTSNIEWVDVDGEERESGRCDIGYDETRYDAKTLNVPGDYLTIQLAVDAAWHGDEILVAPGTWPGFSWPGNKRLHIRSSGGANVTFIDGNLPYSTFSLVEIKKVGLLRSIGRDSILEGFTIQNAYSNTGSLQAAGFHIQSVSPTIERCIFTKCQTTVFTAAITVRAINEHADPMFRSCMIIENESIQNSPVQSIIEIVPSFTTNKVASTHFQGCTLAGNSATNSNGDFMRATGGEVIFENSIIWGNSPSSILDPDSQLRVEHCNIQGGFTGQGNISVLPQFEDAANGDYHLKVTSPCVNAGNPNLETIGEQDIDGNSRRLCTSIDIGADETIAVGNCPITVGPGGYASIQDAIDASSSGDTITVLPGVYRETIRFKGKAITVIGSGTSGPNESVIDADYDEDGKGDFSAVIFMDGEGPNSVLKNFRIVNGENRQISNDPDFPTFSFTTRVLKKLINALGSQKPPTPNGGGIICFNSSPSIENCLIEDCTTEGTLTLAAIGSGTGSGGGVAVVARNGGVASPTFKNCTIRNNSTGHGWSLLLDIDGGSGAGVFCSAEDASSTAHVTLEDCQIINNQCGFSDDQAGHGGGIAVIGEEGAANAGLTLRRCDVSNNVAGFFNGKVGNGGNGGGLYLRDVMQNLIIEDVTFIYNEAGASTRAGAQVNFQINDPPLADDTHSGKGGDGGAIYLEQTPSTTRSLTLNRCLIGGNKAGSSYACFAPSSIGDFQSNHGGSGGGIYVKNGFDQNITVNLNNCFLVGNETGSGVGTGALTLDLAGNGGAILLGAGSISSMNLNINSCTIADNLVGTPSAQHTGGFGAGIHLSSLFGGTTVLKAANSILYYNGPHSIFANQDAYSALQMELNYCNIEGGWTGPGIGNMTATPQFLNRFVDYHLAAGSAGIDAGGSAFLAGLTIDYDGDAREIGTAPDMGADESTTPGSGTVHPWPGTQDDLLLVTRINGIGVPTAPEKSIFPGDGLAVEILTPGGTFGGFPWILAAVIFPQGSPPAPTPGLPDVHVLNGGFTLAQSESGIGFTVLGPTGISFPPAQIPAYLIGDSILLQAFVLTPAAANGFYASTDGHEIKVM